MLASTTRLFPVNASALLPEAEFINCRDIQFSSCRYNSGNIQSGDLYLALEDPALDSSGVEEAIQRGACGVVVRKELFSPEECPSLKDVPLCLISNPHAAYAKICQALYGNPSRSMNVFGVTGTHGKQVVSYLVSMLFARRNIKTGVISQDGIAFFAPKTKTEKLGGGFSSASSAASEQSTSIDWSALIKDYSFDTEIDMLSPDTLGPAVDNDSSSSGDRALFQGRNILKTDMTNLPPKKTAYWLARMKQLECTEVVLEVSQSALDKANLTGIQFQAGCVTHHRPYKSQARRGTVPGSPAASVGRNKLIDSIILPGFSIINADDAYSQDILRDHNGAALTFGLGKTAQVQGIILEQDLNEQLSLITAGSQTMPLRTPIIGQEYLSCCLCAIATGLAMKMELAELIGILESINRIPGYMQRIEAGQNFKTFLVHGLEETDDPLTQNLKTLRELTSGRIILVLTEPAPCDQEYADAFDPSVLNADTDWIVLVSKRTKPGKKANQAPLASELYNRLKESFDTHVVRAFDRQTAIQQAILSAKPNDCVVIAGKDNLYCINDPNYLSDEEIVQQVLYVDLPNREIYS